ncbi:MAG: hypothetical protein GXO71_03995 [Caldiserica bacterium]|nr:hypothetical protein [Caldisericota bacterium]
MKAIIVYFSKTGNTEALATLIEEVLKKKEVKTDTFSVKGAEGAFVQECFRAFTAKEVSIDIKNLEEYDLIFLGSPIWAFSPVPAISSFVKHSQGWKGKKVFLFFTFGSGTGRRRAERVLGKLVEKQGGEVISVLQIKGKLMKMPERIKERVSFFIDTSLPDSK